METNFLEKEIYENIMESLDQKNWNNWEYLYDDGDFFTRKSDGLKLKLSHSGMNNYLYILNPVFYSFSNKNFSENIIKELVYYLNFIRNIKKQKEEDRAKDALATFFNIGTKEVRKAKLDKLNHYSDDNE